MVNGKRRYSPKPHASPKITMDLFVKCAPIRTDTVLQSDFLSPTEKEKFLFEQQRCQARHDGRGDEAEQQTRLSDAPGDEAEPQTRLDAPGDEAEPQTRRDASGDEAEQQTRRGRWRRRFRAQLQHEERCGVSRGREGPQVTV